MDQSVNSHMDNMNSWGRSLKMKNTSLNNASSSSLKVSALMAIGASSSMIKVKLETTKAITMSSNSLG